MAGHFIGSTVAPYWNIQKFLLNTLPLDGLGVVLPLLASDISFLTARGGSVTCTPPPNWGINNMFDGTLSYAEWSNPTGSIVVEITFPQTYYWGIMIYVTFHLSYRAQNIVAEYYDPVDAQWKPFGSAQNWPYNAIGFYLSVGANGASKLRLTFSNFARTDYFRVVEIGLTHVTSELFTSYLLSRGGAKMFGDIDMNNKNINNPNLVDGVDVSAHASRHRKDGADPLPTGAPAAISEGASASEGSSAVFARADHVHATPSQWTPKVHGNDKHSPSTFGAIVWRVPSGTDWSGTAPTDWTTLNFQGIWGNRRVLACITVYNAGAGDNNYNFRCPDYNRPNSHLYADTYPGITKCRVASATSEAILIWTDAYGLISWRAQNAYSTLLWVEWYMYVP
jgi:hypothetical protein